MCCTSHLSTTSQSHLISPHLTTPHHTFQVGDQTNLTVLHQWIAEARGGSTRVQRSSTRTHKRARAHTHTHVHTSTTHHLHLTTYNSPPTTHHLQLTACNSPVLTLHSLTLASHSPVLLKPLAPPTHHPHLSFDVVIDDGAHTSTAIMASFQG